MSLSIPASPPGLAKLWDRTAGEPEPAIASGTASALPSAIGGHRILRLVGEGGMGIVYEAEPEALQDSHFDPRTEVSADARHVVKHMWIIFVLLPIITTILLVVFSIIR